MDRFRLLLVASLVTVSLGCATWEDYRDSRGAGKADAEVAIFKAHLEKTRRIVSVSDGHVEYEYDPAQKGAPWSTAHPRIRLLPGQYTITAKTWPFGSLYDFEVDLKAGHVYKVETFLCNFECRSKGQPYRHDRWIQDLSTREQASRVVFECYKEIPRRGERRKVPCPDDEDDRASRNAVKADAEAAIDEEDDSDTRDAGIATAETAIDKKDDRGSHGAGMATAVVAKDEDNDRDSASAGKADAEAAIDEIDSRDSLSAGIATAESAIDEKDDRDSRSADKLEAEVAIFKAHLDSTHRIVSASEGRIVYQYDPERKRTPRSDPYQLIRLQPGQHTITAKTWPFGSIYEFEVDLKAGHVYKVETYLCNFRSLDLPILH